MGACCRRNRNKADDGTGITNYGSMDAALTFYHSHLTEMEKV